jgi:hypothetical protein
MIVTSMNHREDHQPIPNKHLATLNSLSKAEQSGGNYQNRSKNPEGYSTTAQQEMFRKLNPEKKEQEKAEKKAKMLEIARNQRLIAEQKKKEKEEAKEAEKKKKEEEKKKKEKEKKEKEEQKRVEKEVAKLAKKIKPRGLLTEHMGSSSDEEEKKKNRK